MRVLKSRRLERGYVQLILYGVLFAAAVGGVTFVIHTYNSAIRKAEVMENERDKALAMSAKLQTEKKQLKERMSKQKDKHDQEVKRLQSQHDSQFENQERAHKAAEKASKEKITNTLRTNYEKYSKFMNKVLPRNARALHCRSDLSTVNDEKACYLTVH